MLWKNAVVIAFALTVASCSKQGDETPGEQEWPKHGLTEAQANEVLVKVGDRTITVGEFADRLASQSPYLQARFESPERRRDLLDNLVRYELLVYEAKRRGYEDDPEVQSARRNIMIRELIKQEVDAPLEEGGVTDEEIQAVYDADPKQFDRPAQIRVSEIIIEDRARAEKVLQKAKKADRMTFSKLAREESDDEQAEKKSGDLGFFTADDETVPKPVRAAAFSLARVGDVHPELIEADDGYHIVMLTGKRAELKRTYEQAKRAIRHKLTRERKDKAMADLTARLRKEVEVEIDFDALRDVRIEVAEPSAEP